MATNERVTNLILKARTEGLAKVTTELNRFKSAQERTASHRKNISDAKAAILAEGDAYKRASIDATRYAKVMTNLAASERLTAAESRSVRDAFALARDRAREAKVAFTQKTIALSRMKSASARARVETKLATTAVIAESAAIAKSTAETTRNAVATERAARSQLRMGAAAVRAGHSMKAQAASGFASRTAAAWKTRHGRGPLGLRPYELTNLGYQVNDVVSGLAMGQRPMQVFTQQAGQIIQIFPKMMTAIFKLAPAIAVLTPFIFALRRVGKEAAALRSLSSQLALIGNSGGITAKSLYAMATAAKAFGVSMKDAKTALLGFAKAGVSENSMQAFLKDAKNYSDVMGGTVPEAATKLSKAFSGGVDKVRALDRQLGFLTATEYQHVLLLVEQGDKTKALKYAQDALSRKLQEAADKAKSGGPWSMAFKNLGALWNNLIDYLKDTAVVDAMAGAMGKLAVVIGGVAGSLSQILSYKHVALPSVNEYVQNASDSELKSQIAELQQEISSLESQLLNPVFARNFGTDINARIAEYRKIIAALKQTMAAPADMRGTIVNDAFQRSQAEIDAALVKRKGAGMEALSAAETKRIAKLEIEKKLALDIEYRVRKQLKDMREQARVAALTSRERFIESALLKANNAALTLSGKLTKDQLETLREQAGLNFDQKTQQQFLSDSGMSAFTAKVVGAESAGVATAKNPMSSATGMGQFIESTWLRMFKQYFPDRASNMSREAILALRKNAEISRTMINIYARENAKILQEAGLSVNKTSLYLAHFLGPSGAVATLTAKAGTPIKNLLSADAIAANKSVLDGKTAGDVVNFAERKMNQSASQIAAQTTLNRLSEKRLKTIRLYSDAFDQRIAKMQFEIELSQKSEQQQFVAKAVEDARLRAQRAGLHLNAVYREEVVKTATELYKSQNAEKIATGELNQLLEYRAQLLANIKAQKAAKDGPGVDKTQAALALVNTELDKAIEKAIIFWTAMGGTRADIAIAKLKQLQLQSRATVESVKRSVREMVDSAIVNTGVNAIDRMGQAFARGKNATEAFFNAFRQGAADFLIQIAKMIAKKAILKALDSGGALSGASGWLTNVITAMVKHDGGVIGTSVSRNRIVPAEIFATAARYHGGGMPGLQHDEVAAILQKGEEVITRTDPRNALNGGGTSNVIVKNVNVIDGADVMEQGLSTQRGEQVFFNFLHRNKRKIQGALG